MFEFQAAGMRIKISNVAQDHRDKRTRFFAPSRSCYIDFSGAPHSVFLEKSIDRITGFLSAVKLMEFIQKVIRFYILQIINDLRIGTNHICDIH
ncbi:hypothetical protein D3C73_1353010 [compost metagenome]